MTKKQPEALRLAEWLEEGGWPSYAPQEASAELRRQNARIVELEAQLAAAPQAVQTNRWIERWHGSGGNEFHEGWSILDEGSCEIVAYLGRDVDSQAVSEIVMAHNATHSTQQGMDVIAGAIALCKHAAKIQNIDFDDYWAIHSDEFKEEAQLVLDAAQAKQGE